MTVVPFPTPPTETTVGETAAASVDRFLDSVQTATTRDSYAETLARLTALAGNRPASALVPEDYAAVMDRWNTAAAATWNRHLSALTSFTVWAGRQEILTTNPGRRLGTAQARSPWGPFDPARPPGQAVHRRPAIPARAGAVADGI